VILEKDEPEAATAVKYRMTEYKNAAANLSFDMEAIVVVIDTADSFKISRQSEYILIFFFSRLYHPKHNTYLSPTTNQNASTSKLKRSEST
jgi:hypothetical protein